MYGVKTEETLAEEVRVPEPRLSSIELRGDRFQDDDAERDEALYSAVTFAEGNFVAAQQDMLLRFLDCDYRGAQTMARALLQVEAENSLAAAIADECDRALRDNKHLLGARLRLAVDPRFLRRLPIDATSVRVLRRLDGATTLRTIVVSLGIHADDVLGTMRGLVARGVIEIAH